MRRSRIPADRTITNSSGRPTAPTPVSKPLLDRIALVTGASRGIGHATAIALAKAGAHVVAVARTVGGLEELDDAINAAGSKATLVPLDLKDYDGIRSEERRVGKEWRSWWEA